MILTSIKRDPSFKGKTEEIITLPKIITVNAFTESSAKTFCQDMSDAENTGQKIIPIVIDSFGGQIYSLLSMVDCIQASSKIIATISLGKSMSCGAALFSFGTDGYRFISPMSTLMIHDVSNCNFGKINELKASTKEATRLNKLLFGLMDKNCKQKKGYFLDLIHQHNNADWYLTAKDTVKHNIANHIRIPKFEVSLTTSLELK
jgi:ATP-dependent Clp endopeptidase proteolytic subunit ClpP